MITSLSPSESARKSGRATVFRAKTNRTNPRPLKVVLGSIVLSISHVKFLLLVFVLLIPNFKDAVFSFLLWQLQVSFSTVCLLCWVVWSACNRRLRGGMGCTYFRLTKFNISLRTYGFRSSVLYSRTAANRSHKKPFQPFQLSFFSHVCPFAFVIEPQIFFFSLPRTYSTVVGSAVVPTTHTIHMTRLGVPDIYQILTCATPV